jgi:hypothetical protein
MAVNDDLIDEALRTDDPPPPSHFFRQAVMRRIYAEAETPALAFPWRAVLIALVIGALAGIFVSSPLPAVGLREGFVAIVLAAMGLRLIDEFV